MPEMFEIVLRPLWWAAGNEQPSPPLHRAAAARLLRCFDKYKSLYSRNMIANRFVVYNDVGFLTMSSLGNWLRISLKQ